MKAEILKEIAGNVENGDATSVKELINEALSENIPAKEILDKGLVRGIDTIGEKFKKNEVFIPEVLIAARAIKAGMEAIRPLLSETEENYKGKIVIGTLKDDLHDIGKNIVIMILEGAGFKVVDLGIDVPKEKFIEQIKKDNPDIIGLSALLTTTMTYMREVIEAIEEAQFRQDVKVIIGGAPVTQLYADEIKADGYAPDASSAVMLVKNLLKIT